jgi:hypothetical protein
MWAGDPVVPQCANHPRWAGQLHDVPGVPCRNYRPKPALPKGDSVRMIPLGDGFYAYVDAADYEALSRHRWHFNNGYASRRGDNRRIYMHSEIMQPPKGMVVDHIDGNKTNNCRFNLRVCTPEENRRNVAKHAGARSRFKGVCYDEQSKKWYAECRLRGKKRSLGHFDSEIEAARAYDRGAVELFGEFVRLNFPAEWPPERRAEVHAQWQATQKLRTEDRRRRPAGRRDTKEAEGKNKVPRAETARRRNSRRRMKTGKSEGKKAKAERKSRGRPSKRPKRRTRGNATGPGRVSD